MKANDMSMFIFTCLRFIVLSKRQKLVEDREKLVYLAPKIVKIYPSCLLHCANSPILALLTNLIKTGISVSVFACLGSAVVFQGQNVVKNKPKIAYSPSITKFMGRDIHIDYLRSCMMKADVNVHFYLFTIYGALLEAIIVQK